MVSACRCFSASDCAVRLVHCIPTLLSTSGELLISLVLFSTSASPFLSVILRPNAHMSHVVISTSSSAINLNISGISHELAALGCSCRKYLPASIWIRYTSTQNLTCSLASFMALSNSFLFLLFLDRFCSDENMVHGGDPITKNGAVSRTIFLTLSLTACFARSHGFPVRGSSRVRSRLQPGTNRTPS